MDICIERSSPSLEVTIMEVEKLRKTLVSLQEELEKRQKVCEDWKSKYHAKKAELAKIMAKQQAAATAIKGAGAKIETEEEKKILAEKDQKIGQLKGKLAEYKKQFAALRERKSAIQRAKAAAAATQGGGSAPNKNIGIATKTKARPSSNPKIKAAAEVKATKARTAKATNTSNFGAKPQAKDKDTKKTFNAKGDTKRNKFNAPTKDGPKGSIAVGMKVSTVDGRRGVVRFIGKLHCAKGTWVGLELFSATGSNSGVVRGKRYFECKPKRGIMLKVEKIKNPAEEHNQKLDEDGVEEIEL
mmetsp:Transcript_25353/g.35344  ORF Transcript_25353/g.35344 Transcript_25353/m.35344 type:complete len:300 (+) Transcript_25353:2-901(+)